MCVGCVAGCDVCIGTRLFGVSGAAAKKDWCVVVPSRKPKDAEKCVVIFVCVPLPVRVYKNGKKDVTSSNPNPNPNPNSNPFLQTKTKQ